jgi:hypothetical protein
MQQATGAAGAIALKLMTDPNVAAPVRLRAAGLYLIECSIGVTKPNWIVRSDRPYQNKSFKAN